MRLDREIKQQIKEYKEKIIKEWEIKKMVINHKMDWAFLEQLIQKCNQDPNLRIDILLSDGTKISMKTMEDKPSYRDRINGTDYEEYR